MTKHIISIIAALSILLCNTSVMQADKNATDVPKKKSDTVPAKTNTQKNKSPSASSALDRALLKQAIGQKQSTVNSKENPLLKIVKSMIQAEKEIIARKTGQKSQQLQKQVIFELTVLILHLEQRQQSNQGSTSSKPSKPQQQPKPGKPETGPSKDKPQTGKEQNKKSKNIADKSAESTLQKRPGKGDKPQALRKEALEKDVWGHLPPTLRQKLLNIYSEKYLPQYDELVRRYFESLAEESRSKK